MILNENIYKIYYKKFDENYHYDFNYFNGDEINKYDLFLCEFNNEIVLCLNFGVFEINNFFKNVKYMIFKKKQNNYYEKYFGHHINIKIFEWLKKHGGKSKKYCIRKKI